MESDSFFTWLGLLTLAAGLYFVLRDWVHTRYGYHAEGVVVELMGKWVKHRGRKSYLYFPVIEFTDARNESKRFVMDVGSNFELYTVGERVPIVYYRNNIYPAGTPWKVFYLLLTLFGFGILLYQLMK
ncbi:MAG: hypothetical protein AVDCRST_MAG56-4140 [uncultured Cytophagales bacterium]|uniref:DUF3592 domain-containing protein n=1 Tax=uncultured Cytophagales bacterium TaxID=158755 RepID=A0A6J4JSH8_9SPHI|nr:MAG: hypothetical protein AVDCRST_MAG56-4140 [uncultured Cytophagales bacterium]